MKKVIAGLIGLTFTGVVAAGPIGDSFYGNQDLYDGLNDNTDIPSAVQPGIGDSYGGSVLDNTSLLGIAESTGRVKDDFIGAEFLDVENLSAEW